MTSTKRILSKALGYISLTAFSLVAVYLSLEAWVWFIAVCVKRAYQLGYLP